MNKTIQMYADPPPQERIYLRPFQTTQVYVVNLADTARASDAITRGGTVYGRTIEDLAPASDALERVMLFVRLLADAAPATDELSHVDTFKPRAPFTALLEVVLRQTGRMEVER